MRLSPAKRTTTKPVPTNSLFPSPSTLSVTLVRGNCPIHRPHQQTDKPPLVHYTDIRDGAVHLNGRRGFGHYRCITGPAIFLPRVGRITVDKIALLDKSRSVMLSDCVIAIKPKHPAQISPLRQKLVSNFAHLRRGYVGTGAPFITLDRLKRFLAHLGVLVDDCP